MSTELQAAFDRLKEASKEFGDNLRVDIREVRSIDIDINYKTVVKNEWQVLLHDGINWHTAISDTADGAIAKVIAKIRENWSGPKCDFCGGRNYGEFAHSHPQGGAK